jgi:hypothetical protein
VKSVSSITQEQKTHCKCGEREVHSTEMDGRFVSLQHIMTSVHDTHSLVQYSPFKVGCYGFTQARLGLGQWLTRGRFSRSSGSILLSHTIVDPSALRTNQKQRFQSSLHSSIQFSIFLYKQWLSLSHFGPYPVLVWKLLSLLVSSNNNIWFFRAKFS